MEALKLINRLAWGAPTVLFIFFSALYFTHKTRALQFKKLPLSIKNAFKRGDRDNSISPLSAACTALGATMGTGNIIGVAGAIAIGGAGAVFWLWVAAALSMIIKFCEIALAVKLRGNAVSYIAKSRLPFRKTLSIFFAVAGAAASLGVGCLTQINTISCAVQSLLIPRLGDAEGAFALRLAVGVFAALALIMILKSQSLVARASTVLVFLMSVAYTLLCLGVIISRINVLPQVFSSIFIGALKPSAVTGGAVGSAFIAIRVGFSRGVFSNEAGMGSAPNAYLKSRGSPFSLGLFGIFETFIDSFFICTLSALAFLAVGNIPYGFDLAASIPINAFTAVYGRSVLYAFCPIVCFFAFSSMIGWGFFGLSFFESAFGKNHSFFFRAIFALSCVLGAVFKSEAVWLLAETLNALMVLPNTAALVSHRKTILNIILEEKNRQAAP